MDRKVKQNIPTLEGVQILEKVLNVNQSQVQKGKVSVCACAHMNAHYLKQLYVRVRINLFGKPCAMEQSTG